eukprot:TRINITY_DN248_c0_g1_i1.p1 TRINITY_DN248_c0_g1~~TRINITY_DN248_c0_g1_i1.p1  ORF type:complete len:207 (+),score=53.61 TRINITY_DN248_c0_g1_i1:300-920(+)
METALESAPTLHTFEGVGSTGHRRATAREWRRFMSPKVSDIFSVPSMKIASVKEEDHDEDIKRILKDVEQLGTAQMSWKERKEWEESKMIAAGGKPPKSHKMPIAMGLAIKKKRQRKEEEQQIPGTKKKLEAKKKPRSEDRGLRLSEGKFKGGILYVKPSSEKPREEDFRGGKVHDRLFNETAGLSKKPGKSRKKDKGKKGKKRRR